MGVFEFPAFAKGTEAIAEALSKSDAITIVGGGDSAAARGAAGLCRQDDPYLHRRRRLPGVHGGQGFLERTARPPPIASRFSNAAGGIHSPPLDCRSAGAMGTCPVSQQSRHFPARPAAHAASKRFAPQNLAAGGIHFRRGCEIKSPGPQVRWGNGQGSARRGLPAGQISENPAHSACNPLFCNKLDIDKEKDRTMNRRYRKTIIAGNWKMNKTATETRSFCRRAEGHHAQAPSGAKCCSASPL